MADTYGIDELRNAVALLNNCREDFNNGGPNPFTAEQLILLYRAYARSEWDITPDHWTSDEIKAALVANGHGATSDRLCAECHDARPVGPYGERRFCAACAPEMEQARQPLFAKGNSTYGEND